jgi:hypothetical protein
MKPAAPAVLRKGAVIRIAAGGADAASTPPAWAISYVDLQFGNSELPRGS